MNTAVSTSGFVTGPCVFFGQTVGEVSGAPERVNAQPLLSIGIPTFNRAARLRSLLHSLVHQCAAAAGQVELIVSDNASQDETAAVVAEFRAFFPITYSRNRANEGACRNLQIIASALARGRFTWLMGDDDLVRPDAVARILAVIEAHPDVHFIFANTSPRGSSEYVARGATGLVQSEDFPVNGPLKSRLPGDRYFERFESLIDPEIDDVFLGSLMCGIFRTEIWRGHAVEIPRHETNFDTLSTSYPHAEVFARTMVGRPAYFLAYPVTIAFWGAQEWIGRVPRLLLLRLQELLALYEEKGVPHRQIVKCRAALVRISRDSLRAMLLDSSLPGFAEFDLERFIANNRECAHVIFEQLDGIVAEARSRRLDNRLLQVASELVRRYPSHKPLAAVVPPPAAPAPVPPAPADPVPVDSAAFSARLAEIDPMLRAGQVREAAKALAEARVIAPNADCIARVDELLAMLSDLPPPAADAPAPALEFFGAEELTNLRTLFSAYERDPANADLLTQVRALRDGLANYLAGAELAQLAPLLAGDFGEVYFKVAALRLADDSAVPARDLASAVRGGFTAAGYDPRPVLVHQLFCSHAC